MKDLCSTCKLERCQFENVRVLSCKDYVRDNEKIIQMSKQSSNSNDRNIRRSRTEEFRISVSRNTRRAKNKFNRGGKRTR